ncbi:hypothetical protein D3C72_1366260 [compost metagenome]
MQTIADRIKPSAPRTCNLLNAVTRPHSSNGLKVILIINAVFNQFDRRINIYIFLNENVVYFIREQLFLLMIGYVLNAISKVLAHLLRKIESILLLQDITDSALA